MNRDRQIHPLTPEVRHYLADRFTAIESDRVNEAFPGLSRERRTFRIETLIEGIVRALARLFDKNAGPPEDLLKEAGDEIKALYPPERYPLIDRLIDFIRPALLGEAAEERKQGAA
jgi:hypothetical protein